jgi:hypothetical protein
MTITFIITVFISAIGIIVAIINNTSQSRIMNDQLKVQNAQIRTDLFAEYTKRYQEIMLHLPLDIEKDDFELNKCKKAEIDQTIRYIRVYFDLSAEEYFLHENGKIEEKVWQEWLQGMKYLINKPSFIRIWDEYYCNTEYYSSFKDFVKSKIIGQK